MTKKVKKHGKIEIFSKIFNFTVFFEKNGPQPPFFSKIIFDFTEKFRDFKNVIFVKNFTHFWGAKNAIFDTPRPK